MQTSEILDIVNTPHAEMDCADAVREALRRMGMHDAADSIPRTDNVEDLVRAHREGVSRWMKVSDEIGGSAREGDVVTSTRVDGVPHVSCYLGGGNLLSSSIRHGVHILPARRAVRVTGVWRWAQ